MRHIPCSGDNYTQGRGKPIEYIVVHYTAGNGDTARQNCRYFANNAVRASAHYFVDETEVCRSVADGDTAWHCGASVYRHAGCRNANSIGVELCSRKDADGGYYFKPETVARAAGLVRELMARYSVDADHVLRHYDVTGKVCPAPFVSDPGQWEAFLAGLAPAKSLPSDWAADAAQWAVEQGLIQGDETGDCRWQDAVTREALAVILHRMAQK